VNRPSGPLTAFPMHTEGAAQLTGAPSDACSSDSPGVMVLIQPPYECYSCSELSEYVQDQDLDVRTHAT
jgi:hypothetical protein